MPESRLPAADLGGRVVRLAPAGLRAHVVSYTGYSVHAAPPRRRVNVPSVTVTLCLTWGAPLRLTPVRGRPVAGGNVDAVMFGLQRGPVLGETSGTGYGVQVELTPLGAYALLAIPLRYLADTMVHPDDVLGRYWCVLLTEQLAAAPDWGARWAILDGAFAARLALGRSPSPVVLEAWSLLRSSRGTVAVGELAEATGRSRRRLEILFGDQIGLPPKSVARILRFQHVLSRIWPPGWTWGDIAAMSGYHDQAHLAREFRALTGLTATEFQGLATSGSASDNGPIDGCVTSVRRH